MKKLILVAGLISSATLFSGCGVSPVTYSPDYSGYSVGYGYHGGDNYYGYGGGYGVYDGYGGWASSYYVPGPN